MLVGGPSLTAAPHGLGLLHALEAEGLALWAFDRACSPSLATVAIAVAGYHFEGCDAVIAVGGGVALEVAKAAALMAGQRTPYRALAPEPGGEGDAVDASAVPALLVVPATPAAALAVGATVWIADDAGVARPLRHPALRPTEAILADDLVAEVPALVRRGSAALAALLAADAGVTAGDFRALLDPALEPGRAMRSALTLAAPVEGAFGPRRRLALTAAVAGGMSFPATMLALADPADWLGEARRRLGLGDEVSPSLPSAALVRAARSGCGPAAAAELDRVVAGLGLDPGEGPRRRGRRGWVA